jgi:glycogen operon protein
MLSIRTARGRCLPLGATALADGVNFAVLCRHGTAVTQVLFDMEHDEPQVEVPLHPRRNRTGDHWHILVKGLLAQFRYGWRVAGPAGPTHRFDPSLILLDPAATALSEGAIWGHEPDEERRQTRRQGDKETRRQGARTGGLVSLSPGLLVSRSPDHARKGTRRRSLFFRRAFDWQEDMPPLTPLEDTIIYEMHVRGFTCDPTSGVALPRAGTFAGLVEKIPYLKWLGVTAVELLPIHEFDECDCPFTNPLTGERLRNFWGYNSIAFAAPKAAYAASAPDHGQVAEFRQMVRAFHSAGLEVYLDVVFNHTGEGDDKGRTYCYRGLDNDLYYMLSPDGKYLNFSGCGNTVNCNHPVVRGMITTCLRYWVADMHVDGLRFDLASVFGRDQRGQLLLEPPIVEEIAEDSVLADTKLIAEPWDAAGLYQLGKFPFGRRWSEWNGRYRDEVRRFWKGEPGVSGLLATRISGSADLYEASGRDPRHSINFITCHDGFTLWDLVSYNRKHNEGNGENNKDGWDANYSWNCGVEGPTDDPKINTVRRRQARNLMATLLLSQGVPMVLGGDEFLRTQRGNNNAYCQDNDVSWVNWHLAQDNADFQRFVRELIWLRRRHVALRRGSFFQGKMPEGPDIIWHGIQPGAADFSPTSRTLAFAIDGRLSGRGPDRDFYVACNSWNDTLPFRIPLSPSGRHWRRLIDTALASPNDIVPEDTGPEVPPATVYALAAHSLLVLISEA